jgi:hypothetical protein
MLEELLLVVPCLLNQLLLKAPTSRAREPRLPSPHVRLLGAEQGDRAKGREDPASSTMRRVQGDILRGGAGEGSAVEGRMVEERDRKEEKRNTPNILLPSPMISSRIGFSPSQVRTCFLGEKKKKKAPSVYFLGWKPEQIQQIFTQGPSHV